MLVLLEGYGGQIIAPGDHNQNGLAGFAALTSGWNLGGSYWLGSLVLAPAVSCIYRQQRTEPSRNCDLVIHDKQITESAFKYSQQSALGEKLR